MKMKSSAGLISDPATPGIEQSMRLREVVGLWWILFKIA